MNYYGVTRSTDHLAHYGVKGMKWGVRRALARGNDKAVDRHFRKAAKKLRKLQDIGLNSKKYAAKSAAYGAAAAGAIGAGIAGTNAAAKLYRGVGKGISNAFDVIGNRVGSSGLANIASKINSRTVKGSNAIVRWGKNDTGLSVLYPKGITTSNGKLVVNHGYKRLTGNDIYRLGAGVTAVGLAAKGAQNAYRASHGAKYRAKASQFKNEMDNAFKGTKYEGLYIAPPRRKKKRR